VPLTGTYWERVVEESLGEMAMGRTPNPDMLCNSRVKFGAFLAHLERELGEFDRVASGHYASISWPGAGTELAQLLTAEDAVKDQTYFLASLERRMLRRLMFPLGGYTKSQVRHLAEGYGLANADRAESQGICFLGKVPFREFVRAHLGTKEGSLVEAETGTPLGRHSGIWFFTIGQRQVGPFSFPIGSTLVMEENKHVLLPSRRGLACRTGPGTS